MIRGLGTSEPSFVSFDPGVGISVDRVFSPRSERQLLDLIDVQQLQVRHGPHRTRFGENTSAARSTCRR